MPDLLSLSCIALIHIRTVPQLNSCQPRLENVNKSPLQTYNYFLNPSSRNRLFPIQSVFLEAFFLLNRQQDTLEAIINYSSAVLRPLSSMFGTI